MGRSIFGRRLPPQGGQYSTLNNIVFSLLGVNGYKFAENIGLKPVREQIMNPEKKILEGGFLGTMRLESEDYRKLHRSAVFLCRTASLPFWIIPLWNNYTVILSCGGTEPIDRLVMDAKDFTIPNSSLIGWVSCRFNSSAAISGTVDQGDNVSNASLAGTFGGPVSTNKGGWLYVVVFHQSKKYIALPLCHEDDLPPSDGISIVDMLSKQEVIGRNLDITKMASTNVGSWAKEVLITAIPMDGEASTDDESDT